jgi:hypothetical protein
MENTETNNTAMTAARTQTAKHLAARAVIALRSHFHVERVALDDASGITGGITCDWTKAREQYDDDEKLIVRGFAFIYAGSIVDQKTTEPLSDAIQKELKVEMSSVQEVREAAVQWGLVASVMDTNPFAHRGYKLASRFIRADEALVDGLATLLLERDALDGAQLLSWFGHHETPLSLEELEQSITF